MNGKTVITIILIFGAASTADAGVMARLTTLTPETDSSSVSTAVMSEVSFDPATVLPWLLKESPSGADLNGASTVTVSVTAPCALSAIRRDGVSKPVIIGHVIIRDAMLCPSPDLDGLLKPPQEHRSPMV